MTESEYKRLIVKLIERGEAQGDAAVFADAFELIKAYDEQERLSVYDADGAETVVNAEVGVADAHEMSKRVRVGCEKLLAGGDRHMSLLMDVELQSLYFDAPYNFDAYLRYVESEREDRNKFYEPRRKQLYPVVNAIQDLEMGRLKLLCVSLPPSTGKSTLEFFGLSWTSGRHPEMQSILASHNIEFVRGAYDELLRIMSPKGEYLYHRVFPESPVVGTNAKDLRIDLGKRKRFQTIQGTSVKSGNAGKLRATNWLCCDDLVESTEQALNRDRMDALWRSYTVDLKQREQGNFVKEIHIATRWSLFDILGRLEATFGGRPDARFINIPVEDEETHHSNFNYPYGLGFTDEMIAELRETMDSKLFDALYMGKPVEYEGQLYPEEELRRYFELPDGEPDAILAVCDTKTTGSDYCVLPIAYQFGNDYYIEDVVCENYAPDIVETSVVQMLLKHQVQQAQFESNVAGGKMAQVCQQRVDEAGGRTHITTKWTNSVKETKIMVNAPWVKKHCIFKDNSVIKGSEWSEYRLMLRQLTGYTLAGKNKHDDVPDAFAQFALYIGGKQNARLKLAKRWF